MQKFWNDDFLRRMHESCGTESESYSALNSQRLNVSSAGQGIQDNVDNSGLESLTLCLFLSKQGSFLLHL